MKTDAATLKHFAELLKVDEVRTFDVIRPAYGFMLRIGVLWQKVEIDEVDLYRVSFDKRIEHIVRILFESARNLRWQVEQEQRSFVIRNIVDEAARVKSIVEPEWQPLKITDDKLSNMNRWIEYASSTVMLSFGLPAEVLGVGMEQPEMLTETPKPAGRFEMICLEIEDL